MSLAKIAETARDREVDLIIIAGDLFDAPIRNSDADSMPKLLDACGALLDAAPVVSVQGTPSHDAPGCYSPIMRMDKHKGLWLNIDARHAGHVIELDRDEMFWVGGGCESPIAIITGLPEPSRGWLSARGEAQGRAETERGRGRVGCGRSSRASGRRRTGGRSRIIHVQHGEVRGATLASGQVLPPGGIAVGTEDLDLTGADYIALGHIHKAQQMSSTWSSGLRPRGTPEDRLCSGSAYPVELGRARPENADAPWTWTTTAADGCHVEKPSTVPYGHPARIKLEIEGSDVDDAFEQTKNLPDVRGCGCMTHGCHSRVTADFIRVPGDATLEKRVERRYGDALSEESPTACG